ncbi:MAG TPA: PilZ domain-containing protein [Pyrinomonadaceae bacterium]|nr:PilZ domain-containing protein [Pyrinomonadaceae bacterium]
MPELIRSIAGRLREFVGNRRVAPRYVTHLEVGLALNVSLTGSDTSARKDSPPVRLAGYTRDISASGLALIVPSIRVGGQYVTGENRRLRIMLKLPTGPIEIHATPVRYSPLDEDGVDTGYLVGVQIISMSDEDRARFNDYLEKMKTEA